MVVQTVVDVAAVVGEPLGWLVVALFAAGALLEWGVDRERARPVVVAAWIAFGLFWLAMVPYFVLEQRSIIEGVGSIIAVPLSLYIGYVLARGRDSLFVLSRAVALMGLVYLPAVAIGPIRQVLIETVTDQTEFLMNAIGYHPTVADGFQFQSPSGETTYAIGSKNYPYDSTFVFYRGEADPITYNIALACTGLGSMAIFVGLIGAVPAPARRKLRALAVSLSVIYVLNLIRNVFIGITFGHQLTHVFPDVIISVFGLSDPRLVSYIVSDRILAQSASVLALLVIVWLVVRELPEVLIVLEDVLYLITRKEYDLGAALGVDVPREQTA